MPNHHQAKLAAHADMQQQQRQQCVQRRSSFSPTLNGAPSYDAMAEGGRAIGRALDPATGVVEWRPGAASDSNTGGGNDEPARQALSH